MPANQLQHVWYIGGVSGVGKTILARRLSVTFNLTYLEGDDLHPQANIAKLSAGKELTDDDRGPWLHAIRENIEQQLHWNAPDLHGIVVACSALKRAYRDILRGSNSSKDSSANTVCVHFIMLTASVERVRRQLSRRKGHFMNPSLLDTQFATLELPDTTVETDCYNISLSDNCDSDSIGNSKVNVKDGSNNNNNEVYDDDDDKAFTMSCRILARFHRLI